MKAQAQLLCSADADWILYRYAVARSRYLGDEVELLSNTCVCVFMNWGCLRKTPSASGQAGHSPRLNWTLMNSIEVYWIPSHWNEFHWVSLSSIEPATPLTCCPGPWHITINMGPGALDNGPYISPYPLEIISNSGCFSLELQYSDFWVPIFMYNCDHGFRSFGQRFIHFTVSTWNHFKFRIFFVGIAVLGFLGPHIHI